jgi:gliding motility-associated-like protein
MDLPFECHASIVKKKKLKITGQKSLTVQQDASITIKLSELVVEADNGLNYPNGFHLEIDNGDNYGVSGTTITPLSGFAGELRVRVRVTNGDAKSEKFNLKITVTPLNNGANSKPVIVNQANIEVLKNQPYTLKFADLVVVDSNDPYPSNFTIKIEGGVNYSVSGRTITPALNFVGILIVKISVNDGKVDSEPYDLKITIKEVSVENKPPVITAQATLAVAKDHSIEIKLTDLSVTDLDDNYPSGFTLIIMSGNNYSLSGHLVNPSAGFVGSLIVQVKVNDGKSDSNIFNVKISVIESGTLQIVGQRPIVIMEDSSVAITTAHLNVQDPSNSYPAGFSIDLLNGDNFSIEGSIVTPKQNFSGNLFVKVTLRKGAITSNTFDLLIVISPVNDAPGFSAFSSEPIFIMQNSKDVPIAREVSVSDVDSEKLVYAEVLLDSAPEASATLSFVETSNIRGVYDATSRLLLFIGTASLEEYTTALRSVTYSNNNDSSKADVVVKFRLNDGEFISDTYEKMLAFSKAKLHLDIPNAFTPNNDNANDVWRIDSGDQEASIKEYLLRVYNKRGEVVFESNSLENLWDGRFKGELLPLDAYFYTITVTLSDASVSLFKGVVTVLR